MPLKDHYKERYGAWSANPRGQAPDFTRCCETVADGVRSCLFSQCSKPNGKGPDGAYCATHNPDAVAARRKKSEEKYRADMRRHMFGGMLKAVKALQRIESGHNDPRELARETLDEFRARDWWKEPE
jgi:hypothetical protein